MSQTVPVCATAELPPGAVRVVSAGDYEIGVFNCDGKLYAIEDRCTHDDGPLAEGTLDSSTCTIECPRHGARFDLTTGRALTLPAFEPVDTFPVVIEDDMIKLEVD
jgi:3-phenylpropionate/trans-cinnamate dioxygenase ferredoxin subunit